MKNILFVLLFISYGFFIKANEGMLIPSVLGAFESEMKSMGMKLSAEDIYSINHASIKDAIIHFGGGCTGSLISNQGLILTNHHCGYYYINSHSTIENNIEKNGFWANQLKDELMCKGLTASRIVRIENVTKKVLAGTSELEGRALQIKIMNAISKLKAEATDNPTYEVNIKPFDFGNSYYLLVTEVFKDVRLVGTPPSSIGKFGGDRDNWVWPRHTGDFSLFRIYTDKNNKAVAYNSDNVPYSPIHHLPISIQPKKAGDFTMVIGFPGRTYQHMVSTQLKYLIEKIRPEQIKMRDLSLSVINPAMEQSEKTAIMYGPKQSRIANSYKKWKGQVLGLKKVNAIEQKIAYEQKYTSKANANPKLKAEFGETIQKLKDLENSYQSYEFAYRMYIEYIYVGAELFDRARSFEKLMKLYKKGDTSKLNDALEKEKIRCTNFFKKFDTKIDKDIFLKQSIYYASILDTAYLPLLLKENDIQELQGDIYENSFLVNEEYYQKVIANFDRYAKKKIYKDPGYHLYQQIQSIFNSQLLNKLRSYYQSRNQIMKTYVKGKLQLFPNDKHWPNANNTLRISYGKLAGAKPRDGMKYIPHTTLEGVIEKNRTGYAAYQLPQRLVELYDNKKYGRYAQDGELWVCILSNNHTTGGNSGSPVINGEGHLVGLNFDRTWEGTMSDYVFDESICRNISVDIRYVLWTVDIYAGAERLIEEMTIVE